MILKKKILNKLRENYRRKHGLLKGLLKSSESINIAIDEYNEMLIDAIINKRPFLVSRFGSAEINWYLNYKILSKGFLTRFKAFITLEIDELEQKKKIINDMTFRPTELIATENYIKEIDYSIPKIDILGSWLRQEKSSFIKFKKNVKFIYLGHLEPYYSNIPWTSALENKKVLVIHPMKKSIEMQYKNRQSIFPSKYVLPNFQLKVLQAPYFDNPELNSWKKIMEYYRSELNKYDFDVAIIGCGSWGMPLAAHIKELGKVAIHLGGATQLLFGIIGSRWETQWPEFRKLNLVNENWIRPLPEETPEWSKQYDKNSYW